MYGGASGTLGETGKVVVSRATLDAVQVQRVLSISSSFAHRSTKSVEGWRSRSTCGFLFNALLSGHIVHWWGPELECRVFPIRKYGNKIFLAFLIIPNHAIISICLFLVNHLLITLL